MNNTLSESPPVVQRYSALFLLDFISRYAVDRCGAKDTVFNAFLSFVCVLPFWIWLCLHILMFTRVELYWAMAKYTILLLTLTTVGLLFLFDTPPPVLGCGPDQCFPSPQAALSAYGACTYFYYTQMAPDLYSEKVHVLMVLNLGIVSLALLHLGMASPPAVLAGTLLGAVIACLLHEALLNLVEHEGALTKCIIFLEKKLGVYTVDSLLSTIHQMGHVTQAVALQPLNAIMEPESVHSSETKLCVSNSRNNSFNEAHATCNISGHVPEKQLECTPLLQLAHPNREVVALDRFTMGYKT